METLTDESGMRCKACCVVKPLSEFSERTENACGYRLQCKQCVREYNAARFRQLKATGKYRAFRRSQTLKAYKISPAEYAALLHEQSGVCAICKCPPPDGMSLCVDHDHKTGNVRGLLCKPCNLILGNASDNPDRLLEAASYLEARR